MTDILQLLNAEKNEQLARDGEADAAERVALATQAEAEIIVLRAEVERLRALLPTGDRHA